MYVLGQLDLSKLCLPSGNAPKTSDHIRVYTICHYIYILRTHIYIVKPDFSILRTMTVNVYGVPFFRMFSVIA